ncbi:protein of unknown function (DUF397) [Actinokineospora globicatena]|nr:protein of unknown function (DUF397) [Actinokineospora globicatena]
MARKNPTHVETDYRGRRWVKSSFSAPTTDCVEVACDLERAHIRSSRNRNGDTLAVPGAAWSALVDFAAARDSATSIRQS